MDLFSDAADCCQSGEPVTHREAAAAMAKFVNLTRTGNLPLTPGHVTGNQFEDLKKRVDLLEGRMNKLEKAVKQANLSE